MEPQHSNAPTPAGGAASRSKREYRLMAATLLLAAVAPFVRALAFGFVYDDTWIVQHNPAIVGWRSLLTLWQHPYWMDAEGAQAGLYRPMHMAFLAIIRNGIGGWPLWFHLYALLLHAATTLLIWRMLARGVRRWPAALAALWFAVHPIHVEAVANISNSAESLTALWTLGLYFVLADVGAADVPWRRALLAASLFLLAMLSKESGVMSLAIALLAAEAWRRPGRDAVTTPARELAQPRPLTMWRRWHRVAFASIAALIVVGLMRSLALGSSLDGGSMAAVGIEKMSVPERVSSMLSLGPVVLRLLAWPRTHNPYYGPSHFPTGSRAVFAVTSTVIVLALAIAGAARLARKSKSSATPDARPLTAIGWTLLAFLPASNLFVATGQILAERTLYLPSIGVAMLLAWGMDQLEIGVAGRRATWTARPVIARLVTVLGCSGLVVVCARFAVLAEQGTAAWRTHRALVDQMIAADARGYRGHYLLAVELRRGGATDSIAHEFDTAYRLYSRDPQLDLDYARFLLEQRQPAQAAQVAGTLMDDSRMRNDADAISVYLEARGRAYGADSVLVAATRLYRLRPHPTLALYMGLAHEARAERTAALNAYRAGLRLAPGDSTLIARAAELQMPRVKS